MRPYGVCIPVRAPQRKADAAAVALDGDLRAGRIQRPGLGVLAVVAADVPAALGLADAHAAAVRSGIEELQHAVVKDADEIEFVISHALGRDDVQAGAGLGFLNAVIIRPWRGNLYVFIAPAVCGAAGGEREGEYHCADDGCDCFFHGKVPFGCVFLKRLTCRSILYTNGKGILLHGREKNLPRHCTGALFHCTDKSYSSFFL